MECASPCRPTMCGPVAEPCEGLPGFPPSKARPLSFPTLRRWGVTRTRRQAFMSLPLCGSRKPSSLSLGKTAPLHLPGLPERKADVDQRFCYPAMIARVPVVQTRGGCPVGQGASPAGGLAAVCEMSAGSVERNVRVSGNDCVQDARASLPATRFGKSGQSAMARTVTPASSG